MEPGDDGGSVRAMVIRTSPAPATSGLRRERPMSCFAPSSSLEGAVIGAPGVAGFREQFGPSHGGRGAAGSCSERFVASLAATGWCESLPHARACPGEHAVAARIAIAIPAALCTVMEASDRMGRIELGLDSTLPRQTLVVKNLEVLFLHEDEWPPDRYTYLRGIARFVRE